MGVKKVSEKAPGKSWAEHYAEHLPRATAIRDDGEQERDEKGQFAGNGGGSSGAVHPDAQRAAEATRQAKSASKRAKAVTEGLKRGGASFTMASGQADKFVANHHRQQVHDVHRDAELAHSIAADAHEAVGDKRKAAGHRASAKHHKTAAASAL